MSRNCRHIQRQPTLSLLRGRLAMTPPGMRNGHRSRRAMPVETTSEIVGRV
jgi:hypothetical protein